MRPTLALPMFRLEPRSQPASWLRLAAPLLAVAFTLLVSSLLVAWAGAPVGRAYLLLLEGGFGSRFAWTETLTRATPLIFTGLAAAVAFRARLFNIGAEGQLYLGALAAVAVGSRLTGLPGPPGLQGFGPGLLFVLMLLSAALAGALLLLVPAWLKSRFRVDEVVTTLLLNFIVLLWVGAMLDGPMKDASALGWPQSVAVPEALQLNKLLPRSRVHTGLLGALVCALQLWLLLKFTTHGLEMRAVGAGARAAAFAGMPVAWVTVKVALLSGALAGLAGAVEVAGRAGYVTLDMSPGYGYSGIVIAMLAALHPLGVVAAAVFVAGILVGADSMSRAVGVPTYIADVINATALLAMLVATLFTQYQVRRVRQVQQVPQVPQGPQGRRLPHAKP
jgi:general nucleoside transport system permease protein